MNPFNISSYRDDNLKLELYENLLTLEDATHLYNELEEHIKWDKIYPIKRINKTFGDKGLVYDVEFRGIKKQRPAIPWEECPILADVAKLITLITGQKYNICVVQRYPNGQSGIGFHRDKEMTPGTMICGLSLGETRTLIMSRGSKEYLIPLVSGSLYILHPPTNDYWAHSIKTDDTLNPRISLTFRNY